MTDWMQRIKNVHSFHQAILLLWGCLAAAACLLLFSGCGGVEYTTVKARTINNDPGATPLTQAYLQEMVTGSYNDAALVRQTTLAGEGMEKRVEIGVDRPATCADGSVEGTMAAFTSKTMANLFTYPEIASVTITMYGIDVGVKSDDVAVKVVVDRATAQEAEWTMLGPMTISSMVSEYYIHPRIVQNANAENGGFTGTHY